MENPTKINQLFCAVFVIILFVSLSACGEELVTPGTDQPCKDLQVKPRSEGPMDPELVKQKVSELYNIPIEQILTCYYYGQNIFGDWEFHLTTLYNGPIIFVVIKIIGDDCDGT